MIDPNISIEELVRIGGQYVCVSLGLTVYFREPMQSFPHTVRTLLDAYLQRAEPHLTWYADTVTERFKKATPDLPPAGADADLIRRVVINLLDNAIKYTPAAGVITLGVKRTGASLTVSVRDTGPGVPEGERERIFDKFMRVQREAAPKGLGLGLAFCKLAVEAHGGHIWVDSGRGPGATFSFTLPLATTAELRPSAAAPLAEA